MLVVLAIFLPIRLNSVPIFFLFSFHSQVPETPCCLSQRLVPKIRARTASRNRLMSIGQ